MKERMGNCSSQIKKKRFIVLQGTRLRLYSKRLNKFKIKDVEVCHTKFNDIHYIFDGKTGEVLTQGLTYLNAINNFKYEVKKLEDNLIV